MNNMPESEVVKNMKLWLRHGIGGTVSTSFPSVSWSSTFAYADSEETYAVEETVHELLSAQLDAGARLAEVVVPRVVLEKFPERLFNQIVDVMVERVNALN